MVGAKKLHNGRVVFELDSAEAVQWLKVEKANFKANLSGTLVIKDRAILVIVEYVPITHSPDGLSENRRIEQDSGLGVDMVILTRWIKPILRWAAGQCTAHLIAWL